MRVHEKPKHAKNVSTKLSDTLFLRRFRIASAKRQFFTKPFCSVMRVIQRLQSVKATVLLTSTSTRFSYFSFKR